jgi:hypothetical protein
MYEFLIYQAGQPKITRIPLILRCRRQAMRQTITSNKKADPWLVSLLLDLNSGMRITVRQRTQRPTLKGAH